MNNTKILLFLATSFLATNSTFALYESDLTDQSVEDSQDSQVSQSSKDSQVSQSSKDFQSSQSSQSVGTHRYLAMGNDLFLYDPAVNNQLGSNSGIKINGIDSRYGGIYFDGVEIPQFHRFEYLNYQLPSVGILDSTLVDSGTNNILGSNIGLGGSIQFNTLDLSKLGLSTTDDDAPLNQFNIISLAALDLSNSQLGIQYKRNERSLKQMLHFSSTTDQIAKRGGYGLPNLSDNKVNTTLLYKGFYEASNEAKFFATIATWENRDDETQLSPSTQTDFTKIGVDYKGYQASFYNLRMELNGLNYLHTRGRYSNWLIDRYQFRSPTSFQKYGINIQKQIHTSDLGSFEYYADINTTTRELTARNYGIYGSYATGQYFPNGISMFIENLETNSLALNLNHEIALKGYSVNSTVKSEVLNYASDRNSVWESVKDTNYINYAYHLNVSKDINAFSHYFINVGLASDAPTVDQVYANTPLPMNARSISELPQETVYTLANLDFLNPNADLKNASSNQFDVGYKFKKDDFEILSKYYSHTIDNLALFYRDGDHSQSSLYMAADENIALGDVVIDPNLYHYSNQRQISVDGLDIRATYQYSDSINLFLNVNHMLSFSDKYDSQSKAVGFGTQKGILGLNYLGKGYQSTVVARWVSTTDKKSVNNLDVPISNDSYPNYIALDLNVLYPLTKDIQAIGRLSNIFNADTESNELRVDEFYLESLDHYDKYGRMLIVGVEVRL